MTRSHVHVPGGGGRCCDQVPCSCSGGGGGGRCCDQVPWGGEGGGREVL